MTDVAMATTFSEKTEAMITHCGSVVRFGWVKNFDHKMESMFSCDCGAQIYLTVVEAE